MFFPAKQLHFPIQFKCIGHEVDYGTVKYKAQRLNEKINLKKGEKVKTLEKWKKANMRNI